MSEASLLRCPAGAGTKGWRQQGRIQAGNKRVYRIAGGLVERHKLILLSPQARTVLSVT